VERKIIAYTNRFLDFYTEQDNKVQEKIEYVLDLVRFEARVPIKFIKYLENTNSIYEVRVNTTFKNIRILCFFACINQLFGQESTEDSKKRNNNGRETKKSIPD